METRECEKYGQLIFEYAEGGLTTEQREELEKHLSVCPDCSAELENARQTLGLIKEGGYKAPDELLPGIMAKVRAENARRRAYRGRLIRRIGSAAAALLVVVGIAASARGLGAGTKGAMDASPSGAEDIANNQSKSETPATGSWDLDKNAAIDLDDFEDKADKVPLPSKGISSEPGAQDPGEEYSYSPDRDKFTGADGIAEAVTGSAETDGEEPGDARIALLTQGAAYVIENILT